jgi:uncharacterized membrane protein YedE/YeeE
MTPLAAPPGDACAPSMAPARRPNHIVLAVGVLLAALLTWAVAVVAGPTLAVASVLGLALGFTLFHSRFGFSSAWRQLVAVGQPAALRAHMLMLAVACVLFAALLAGGIALHGAPRGLVQPVGVALLVGAFLFGVGMQVAGSCSSGTLFAVGGGQSAILLTLFGFVIGSVLAALHYPFWFGRLPAGHPVSLAALLGYPGALAASLATMALVTALSSALAHRRRPPPVGRPPGATGAARVLRGVWPMWVGALVLAGLNAAVLFVTGQPWGVTTAFGLWGGKFLQAVGVDVARWPFWTLPANAAQLRAPVLADRVSVLDFGIMIGAMIASAAGGSWRLHRAVPGRLALGAALGGVIMGYGARLAGGCNIGAYLYGIASFSLHGWIWGATALAGSYAGLHLRPLFGLTNPAPTDATC